MAMCDSNERAVGLEAASRFGRALWFQGAMWTLMVAIGGSEAMATPMAYTNHLSGGEDWRNAAAEAGYQTQIVNFNAIPDGPVASGQRLELMPGVALMSSTGTTMNIRNMPIRHTGTTDGVLSHGQGRWQGSDDSVLHYLGRSKAGLGPDLIYLDFNSNEFAAALGLDDVDITGVLFNVYDWYTGRRSIESFDYDGNLIVEADLASYNFQQQRLYSFGMLGDVDMQLAQLYYQRTAMSDGFFMSGFTIAYRSGNGNGGNGGGGGGTEVPEPATLLLSATGLLGAHVSRKRRRAVIG